MEFMSMEHVKNVVSTLSLWDDGFFSKCMDGSTECASLMLSVILGRDDLTVESASAQKWLQSVEEHSAKLDVLAHDREGNAYDIEMQKDEKGAGRKRARYYSAMMDADALGKGKEYEELPGTFVIFITPGDAIGKGQALYEIERTIKGTAEGFGDGTHIVYVSSLLAPRDTELGMLMHDLACTDPKDMHYEVLRKRVSYLKDAKEGIAEMGNEFDMILRDVRNRSLDEGRNEGIEKVAKSMIADGALPLSKVAEYSGLSISEVESIRRSIKA